MMGQLPALETRKAIDKSHEGRAVERADQHAARFLRRDEMRQRYDIEIRNAPDFLLQILNRVHLRELINLAYADVRDFRRNHYFTSIGSAMYDACRPERNTFCVAGLKSDSFARKMLGTNVCGLRSMTGNQVLWTWTMIRGEEEHTPDLPSPYANSHIV